jgi:hypothetical protein
LIFVIVGQTVRGYFTLLGTDSLAAIAGIAFMLIQVRIGLGWSLDDAPPKTFSTINPRQPSRDSAGQAVRVDILQLQKTDEEFGLSNLTLNPSLPAPLRLAKGA